MQFGNMTWQRPVFVELEVVAAGQAAEVELEVAVAGLAVAVAELEAEIVGLAAAAPVMELAHLEAVQELGHIS